MDLDTPLDLMSALHSFHKVYLHGPFGAGKTTAALERIRWLLDQERVRGDDILVLVPQRTLAHPYERALRGPDMPPGPPVRITTFAGLARAAVELYWPLLAEEAGFADPRREPIFLNLETAQYHMGQFVQEAFDQGEFDAVRVHPGRVVSQVLDNLNKAALHGFTIDEAYARLELAVPSGERRAARVRALQAARRISHQFRALCLERSLVDFSLWIQLFNRHVLAHPWSRTHLFRSHRHLVMDNAEEDTYAAHELVRQWMPHLDSALVIVDEDAGYRVFLGAAPDHARRLAEACPVHIRMAESRVVSPAMARLAHLVDAAVQGPGRVQADPSASASPNGGGASEPGQAWTQDDAPVPMVYQGTRFYPQMIDWVVDRIEQLVRAEGRDPGQIAVLAPFVSDALRFSLQTRLAEREIPSTTHRPSRALNTEPAVRAMLTLAALAHPHWQQIPSPSDVTLALHVAIQSLDPIRAHLLVRVAYQVQGEEAGTLRAFDRLRPPVQQRITYQAGEQYERLRSWLASYRAEAEPVPLDQFLARLFGEVLSQPGFGFHQDGDAARIADRMVRSARNFRWAVEPQTTASDLPVHARVGKAWVELVQSGAIGALYIPGWQEPADAVFIAPAYTFLMRNRTVDIQFWLDIGASGWWERLYQPLTHPYVLSHDWPPDRPWTDLHEFRTRQEAMRRLLLGLVRRARERIYLAMSDYGENGTEQRGPLLTLINRVLVQADRPPVPLS